MKIRRKSVCNRNYPKNQFFPFSSFFFQILFQIIGESEFIQWNARKLNFTIGFRNLSYLQQLSIYANSIDVINEFIQSSKISKIIYFIASLIT